MAQGIAMPYGQAAAMAEIPRLAGTAAGIGVFLQHLFAAISRSFTAFLPTARRGRWS